MADKSTNQTFSFPAIELLDQIQRRAEERNSKEIYGLRQFEESQAILEELLDQEKDLTNHISILRNDMCQLQSKVKIALAKGPVSQASLQPLSTANMDFEWRLKPHEHIPNPVCKGKYFRFQVKLVSTNGATFPQAHSINVGVTLLTSDSPAVAITENILGYPIFRGETKVELRYDPAAEAHIAKFKIQVTEVSSHFLNGWVCLAVSPYRDNAENPIFHLIEPMTYENFVIRAKEKTCRKFLERERRGIPQQRVKNTRITGMETKNPTL